MAKYSDITGRYLYLDVDGIEYRVYLEEAGSGIPLVCQHTAGSDGRQYRHLLEDPDVTSRFRVIAVDLPYHGKSLPPDGVRFWEQEYKLKKTWFMNFWVALVRALELDQPVYMGCSMGGHLAGDLALNHPDEFRACIGLEASCWSGDMDQLIDKWWHHPRLSNESKPAAMLSLCSPNAPEARVRETVWMYSQGAPAVFAGDLNYYGIEHDLRETAQNIDTAKCMLYVLSGDYDWSAYPEAAQELANKVPGATYTLMEGMGHFPMSEDPVNFKRYITPVLDDIVAKSEPEPLAASGG
ncbi:MAG: alpha/beta fold hydrolase [Gammaproteobacteria bacterium]|jgi:pimeloyl-ACP methyl ester carboxylesterase